MNIYDSLNSEVVNSIVARWLSDNNQKVIHKKHESISPTSIVKISNSFTRFENSLNSIFTNIENTSTLQTFKADAKRRVDAENRLEAKKSSNTSASIANVGSILKTTAALNEAIKQLGIAIQNNPPGACGNNQLFDLLDALEEEGGEAVEEGGKSIGKAGFLSKYGGRLLGAVGGLIDFANRQSKGQTLIQSTVGAGADFAGATYGAEAGGTLGAEIGGSIGALFGGVGAVPGAAIGGAIGFVGGGFAGYEGAKFTADTITGARAVGGPVKQNKTYLVGENGPELFTAETTGKIIPLSNKESVIKYNIIKVVANPQKQNESTETFRNILVNDSNQIKTNTLMSLKNSSDITPEPGSYSFNLANVISDTISRLKNFAGSIFGGSSGGGGGVQGAGSTDNALKAINFFKSKGWSSEQAAGIVGNLQQESGPNLNPTAQNSIGMYGIAQWDKIRRAEFEKLYKKPIYGSSFEEQLEYIQYELTQGARKNAGEALKNAKSPEDAANIVNRIYEGAAGQDDNKRVANAVTLLNGLSLVQGGSGIGSISSSFGTSEGRNHKHGGIDIKAPLGYPIRAPVSGTITFAGRTDPNGFGTLIRLDHGDGTESLYGHVSALGPGIKQGTKVNAGDLIGNVGKEGDSTGPHLHMELRRGNTPIDPTQFYATHRQQMGFGEQLQPPARGKVSAPAAQTQPAMSPWGTPVSTKLQAPNKQIPGDPRPKYYAALAPQAY